MASASAAAPPPPVTTNEVAAPLVIAAPQPLSAGGVQASNPPPPTPEPTLSRIPAPGSSAVVTSVPPASVFLPEPGYPILSNAPTSLVEGASAIFPPWPTNLLRGPMVSLNDWAAHYGVAPARRMASTPQPTYELKVGEGRAVIRVGSPKATVRGVDVVLCHIPQFVNGEPALHWLDFIKTLHPLLWAQDPIISATNRLVVVDPGHGGRDVGTGSPDARNFEKRMTLDWALRLKPLLEKQGYRVLLTRTNDVEVPLAHRVFFAAEAGADVFVSLHFNSAYPVNGRKGLETYALTPPGLPSTVVRDGEDNTRLMFPNNAYDAANLLLAWRIQRGVVSSAGVADRGVQRARFMGVLRGQSRPAVLVEGGYLSNAEEARRIADASYRQKLAEGVASAFKNLWAAE